MDHTKILKRAWYVLWNYRTLWVFGIILALTTSSWGSSNWASRINDGDNDSDPTAVTLNLTDDYSITIPDSDISPEVQAYLETHPEFVGTLIGIVVGLVCFIFLLSIVAAIARYVSETSLIRLVDDYEETDERRSVKHGIRLGWSRAAWRLFLINLLVDLPAMIVFAVLFALTLTPLLLWTTGSAAAGIVGTVAAIGFFLLMIVVVIIGGAALRLLKRFARRVCALEQLGVTESIRQGYAIIRRNLKDVGLMWLIMLGISIGWPIVMIPVAILLVAVATMLGGGSALLMKGLTGLAVEGPASWILGGAVGIPVFILVLVVPLAFLGGLLEVFKSSTWTMTYRELRALGRLESGPMPALDAAGMD